jgi:glycosyltransferase involved in cell wall biosynthesis
MKFLFLHPNFPAQFRYVTKALAQNSQNQVVFITARKEGSIPGVKKVVYQLSRSVHPQTHHYVASLEEAVLHGQAVYRSALKLKAEGFIPDVIYGHSVWGQTLFLKELFPKAKLLCYFEWYYRAHGSDMDFDPAETVTTDDEARIRVRNAAILLTLEGCDRGICPSHWQKSQFPKEFHHKLDVVYDRIDTDFFCPDPTAKMVLPSCNLDLSHAQEIVTYVARGLEPYRGFPQFIEAIALLQQQRPECHAVIVGEDRVVYGAPHVSGKTYKQVMLEKLDLDSSRVHFVGIPPWQEYRRVFQASSVHVHLCRPFLLSWSLLEAIAVGCRIVASNTPPVLEVIQDGVNGTLVDFFDVEAIAVHIEEVLNVSKSTSYSKGTVHALGMT